MPVLYLIILWSQWDESRREKNWGKSYPGNCTEVGISPPRHVRMNQYSQRRWLVPSRLSVSEGSGSLLGKTNEAKDDGKEDRKGKGRLVNRESKSWIISRKVGRSRFPFYFDAFGLIEWIRWRSLSVVWLLERCLNQSIDELSICDRKIEKSVHELTSEVECKIYAIWWKQKKCYKTNLTKASCSMPF